MTRISLNMKCVNRTGTGIAVFADHLIQYLQNNTEYQLTGCYNKGRGQCGDLSRFHFPIYHSHFPIRLVYNRVLCKPLPFPYSLISNDKKADINLYFTWNIVRARHRGITIATIHDLIALRTEMENQQIVKNQISDLKFSINNCQYIFTVSETSKKDIIEEFNFPSDKIFVIPNGVEFEMFNKPISIEKKFSIKRKYGLPNRYILYLGGMRRHKNIERLIKAYALLPESLRAEVGLVISKGTDALRNLTNTLDIANNVVFTPFIDEEDKAGIYQMADVSTNISLYEGFGIPVIEAQAASTPVITSNVSSLPEVAGNSAVCVDPTDIQEISNAMYKLLTDHAYSDNIRNLGLLNAKHYSWDNAGKILCQHIETIKKRECL